MNFKNIFFLSILFLPNVAGAQPVESKIFKVGVIAPLSGPLAEYGVAAKNGIHTAVGNSPDDFSNVEFIYEDSQWISKNALSAFEKLRSVENVSLILNWGNPTTEALAPVAESTKTPLIGMTLDPKVAIGKKYVVRSTNASDEFSESLAQYLYEKKYQKIGVVVAENTYVQGLYDGLESWLGEGMHIEIVESFNMSDNNFRSAISKIRAKKYDAIGVFLISGQVSTFYRQLAEQKITVPTFGTDFFESTSEIEDANGGMDGAVYPHLGTSEEFRKKYIARYGNDFQIAYAGNWHDMALVIGSLFNEQPDLTNDEIMMKIHKSTFYKGVCGEFKFIENENGGPHFSFPVKMKKINGLTISEIK